MYKTEDLGNPKNYALNPELSLWASVVELAIHDYLHGNHEDKNSATNWIFTEEGDKNFNTFQNLCFVLNLDPDAVRERLKRITPKMYRHYRMNYRSNKIPRGV